MTALLIEYFKLIVLLALIASVLRLSRIGERTTRRRPRRAGASHATQ
jgi:hypothetical protein